MFGLEDDLVEVSGWEVYDLEDGFFDFPWGSDGQRRLRRPRHLCR